MDRVILPKKKKPSIPSEDRLRVVPTVANGTYSTIKVPHAKGPVAKVGGR